MTSYYLHYGHISMCLHCLHCCQGTSVFHDDFAVVGFTQSKYRQACTALLTHLKQNITKLYLGHMYNMYLYSTKTHA